MRSLKNIKLTVLATAFALFGFTANAVSIPQKVQELKNDYEYKLKQYQTALKEGTSSVINQLSSQVKQAKEKYDRAVKAITPSETTKQKVGDAVDTVTDTTKDVFNIGSGDKNNVAEGTLGEKSLDICGSTPIKMEGDNYCGQFAMTALLRSLGVNADAQKIYDETNPSGIFTAPTTITEYLNMNGVDASTRQNASLSDIASQIDKGYPVMALVCSDGNVPHWVCVYGYETDRSGNIINLKIRDSYWGVSSGTTMSASKFQEAWNAPLGNSFGSKFVDYKNVMISIKGTKQPDKSPRLFNFNISTATEDNIASGINDVVTGFKRFKVTQLGGGLVKCVLGIPGAAVGVASNGVSKLSNTVFDWGTSTFKQSGLANKIAGGGAVAVGLAGKAVGAVGEVAGDVLSGVANIAGNFVKKLGYVFRQQ